MYWQIGLLLADIGRCLEIKISRGLLRGYSIQIAKMTFVAEIEVYICVLCN